MKEFVIVARETMTRRSELLNLTKYDVNFDNYTAFIPKTKNGTPRHIGLSPRAIEVLKSLPLAVDGRYFPLNMFSPKYAKNNFSKAFARCVKKAGLENFRLHDCRHISATLAAEDGWTISELSAQGGWKSLSQLKRYTHVRAEKLAAKMRNMA
jgi:integrase